MVIALVLGDEGSMDPGRVPDPGPGWAGPVHWQADMESGIGTPKGNPESGVEEVAATNRLEETANAIFSSGKGLAKGLAMLCLLSLLVAGTLPGVSSAAGAAPDWKIGRSIIRQTPSGALLKLSLRNQGGPGKDEVRLLGRWLVGNTAMVTLGQYSRQVALKQTAILHVPLSALGPRPGNAPLELVVYTGNQRTDQRQVR